MPELLPELSVRRRGGRLGMYLERLNKILKLQKLLHPIQQRNRLFLRNLFMLGRLRRLQNLLLFLPAAKFFQLFFIFFKLRIPLPTTKS